MARASPALRGFVHAFNHPNPNRGAVTVSAFLAPAIVLEALSPERPQALKYPGSRRQASATASPSRTWTDVNGHVHSKRGLPLEVELLVSSPRRLDPAAWATAIDPYLPLKLRLRDENVSEEVIQHQTLRPIITLAKVLAISKSHCKADLLSYIGVYQERWGAVVWLVKAMLEKYPGHSEMGRRSDQLPPRLWRCNDQSLDKITENAIRVETPQPLDVSRVDKSWSGRLPLEESTWPCKSDRWNDPYILWRNSLGQIWQSLGTMILQAADRPSEDPSYSDIMSHVFQILGYLHRVNAFPDSIYDYSPPADTTVPRRPPTLYMQSRRIMSTLSDVEWVLQWDETIAEFRSQGYELPKATVQPKIREFGPELWLDFVLWACVEGGWIIEGARIVMEMERRMASKDTWWSTISWREICETKKPELNWLSTLKLEIEKVRLNQVGGLGIATGTNTQVEMGTRTVSREVVLALMDGLFNGPQHTAGRLGMKFADLWRSIGACKSLLERNHSELEGKFMDAAILRVLESYENLKEQPEALDRFLDLKSTESKQVTRSSGPKNSAQDRETEDSAAILGLRYRNLHRFSTDGNLQGSLQTLKKIQETIDSERAGKILAFADELRERLGRGDDDSDLVNSEEDYVALTQPPQIPPSALVSFLDLITNSRLFDLGNWLLLNDDIDGGLMNPTLYFNQDLQPALLRFGTATSSSPLLTRILENIETPISEPILHALLRFQAVLGKWTAVEELLEYLKNAPHMTWKPSDATTIAKVILQSEHEPSRNVNADSVSRALTLVQNLVNGKYNSKPDPSQLIPDFSEMRMANQLGRILRTLPGSLRNITIRPAGKDLRAHASIDIRPNAFNLVLETIANCYGSVAGKELWDQWCRAPITRMREQRSRPSFGDRERVVTPTLYMLRSVLRPILETKQALQEAEKADRQTQESKTSTSDNRHPTIATVDEKFRLGDDEQSVLDWGVVMFREFGLSKTDIRREIPGSFPPSGKAKNDPGDGATGTQTDIIA